MCANVSSYSVKPQFSCGFVIWKAKKANHFAGYFISVYLLRTQWNAAIRRRIGATSPEMGQFFTCNRGNNHQFLYREDSDCDDSLGTFTAISERLDIKLLEWPTKPRFHAVATTPHKVYLKVLVLVRFCLLSIQVICFLSWSPIYQLRMLTRTTHSLYLSFSPSVGTGELDAVTAIENCIRDIRQWMCVRKLMLNDDKTEFLLVGTRKQLTKVSIDGVRVGDYNISPSPSVLNLGTWFDPHLDMNVHITKNMQQCILLSL